MWVDDQIKKDKVNIWPKDYVKIDLKRELCLCIKGKFDHMIAMFDSVV